MTDEPRRLLDGGGSELERSLLSSALDEQPSGHAMRRASVALAAATGVGTFTRIGWAAREAMSPLTLHTGKVVAGTLLIGSAGLVGSQMLSAPAEQSARHDSSPHNVAEAGPSAETSASTEGSVSKEGSALAVQLSELGDEESEAGAHDSRGAGEAEPPKSLRPAPKAKATAPSITEEIAALDVARAKIDSGDSAAGLQDLDAYAQKFRGGRLGQEATVMRIKALVQLGESARARTLARNFRLRYPESPYNKRIESIVGTGR